MKAPLVNIPPALVMLPHPLLFFPAPVPLAKQPLFIPAPVLLVTPPLLALSIPNMIPYLTSPSFKAPWVNIPPAPMPLVTAPPLFTPALVLQRTLAPPRAPPIS